jgi:prefoldin alpha subunit
VVEQKELQEKVMVYRILEARLQGMLKQRDMIASKIVELQTTLSSMDEILKGEEVLFPVGGEAYTLGKVTEKNSIIVEIGAGIAMKKTVEEGKDVLDKRIEEMNNTLRSIQTEIIQLSNNLELLGPEINELAEQLKKE